MIASMVATKQSKQNASQDHAQKPGITPPLSVSLAKQDDDQCSELSDMEGEEDNGEIEPDHYYENGRIPVFKPVSVFVLGGDRNCGRDQTAARQFDYTVCAYLTMVLLW